uniref:Transcription factor HNF-4 (DHNF4) n=1 Tax=Apis cerana TaxID=7461 RepID=V9IJD2_APICE
MTDTDLIKIMLVENSREIMDVTNIFRITVHNHLMNYINRCEVWISQLLMETSLINRVFMCDLLLQ